MTFLRTHLPVPQATGIRSGLPRVVVSVLFAKACGNPFGLLSATVRGIDFALGIARDDALDRGCGRGSAVLADISGERPHLRSRASLCSDMSDATLESDCLYLERQEKSAHFA